MPQHMATTWKWVDTHRALAAAAAAGDRAAFEAADRARRAIGREYRADLERLGFPAPHGICK
ncbi:hypothetical protein [Streptomyces omiyaensis]|uniref:hypothetical protein n=1 Tax=Streptomyces omiyaensis TaxID=68247 RepID=UPI0036F65C38